MSRSGGRSAAGATRRVVATRVVTGAAIRTPQVTRVSNDEYHDEYWPFILGYAARLCVVVDIDVDSEDDGDGNNGGR